MQVAHRQCSMPSLPRSHLQHTCKQHGHRASRQGLAVTCCHHNQRHQGDLPSRRIIVLATAASWAVPVLRPAVSEALEQATGEQQQAPQDQQQPQGSLFVTPEFTFTVPPGWEEVVEQAPSTPQAAGFGATYDGRPRGAPKISPVKARFSSPEGAQISVVERRSAEIKPTFLQVSDISGFGDLAAVQQLLVPPGSTVLRKEVQVQQQPQRQTTLGLVDTPPKNMFVYEFTQNGKHILMAAAAARGRVWITGGFAADSAWPRLGATIQTAVQSFKLNAPIIS